jgi:predicted DNA-binding transcriptional regulator AlpA
MIFRFDDEDVEALAQAIEPMIERAVVRALGGQRETSRSVRYLTRKQVAKAFGISPRTVDRYEEAGTIPRRRHLGPRTVRWLEHEVHEAILANQAP